MGKTRGEGMGKMRRGYGEDEGEGMGKMRERGWRR